MNKLIILRRISQCFFLTLFIYILWSTTYPLKGVLSPQILFKIDPLVMLTTLISVRLWLAGLIFSFVMIGLTLMFGRFFCGWICPLGTFIDGAGVLSRKKRVLPDQQNEKIRRIKFVILLAIFLLALGGIQAAWVMDPIVVVGRVVSLNIIPAFTLIIDKSFVSFIKIFHLYNSPVYDFYSGLKNSLLGVNVHFFANSLIALGIFLLICSAALFLSRGWCRMLCPLGAFYGLLAKFALLERKVTNCTHCKICYKDCRMGAIKSDASYVKGECILCMDCIYDCPNNEISFGFQKKSPRTAESYGGTGGMTRADFLFLCASSFAIAGCAKFVKGPLAKGANIIRPPGVSDEEQFLNACVRCGNCMKVCITNGLQPVMLKSGLRGIWTPELIPEIGYCEHQCTLCGEVCPTAAIPKLSQKTKMLTRLGTAVIDQATCLPWAHGENCIVCEEHCPVAEKAIKLEEVVGKNGILKRPKVDTNLCIGCGICQNKCPVRPVRAIRVKAVARG